MQILSTSFFLQGQNPRSHQQLGLTIFMKEKEATYPIRRRRDREERTPAEVK
jgi:hypothetical protein